MDQSYIAPIDAPKCHPDSWNMKTDDGGKITVTGYEALCIARMMLSIPAFRLGMKPSKPGAIVDSYITAVLALLPPATVTVDAIDTLLAAQKAFTDDLVRKGMFSSFKASTPVTMTVNACNIVGLIDEVRKLEKNGHVKVPTALPSILPRTVVALPFAAPKTSDCVRTFVCGGRTYMAVSFVISKDVYAANLSVRMQGTVATCNVCERITYDGLPDDYTVRAVLYHRVV